MSVQHEPSSAQTGGRPARAEHISTGTLAVGCGAVTTLSHSSLQAAITEFRRFVSSLGGGCCFEIVSKR